VKVNIVNKDRIEMCYKNESSLTEHDADISNEMKLFYNLENESFIGLKSSYSNKNCTQKPSPFNLKKVRFTLHCIFFVLDDFHL